MSQAHVTDFFSARKKTNGANPSKRRKLQEQETTIAAFSEQQTNLKAPSTFPESITDTRPENAFSVNLPKAKSTSRSYVKKSSKKGVKCQTSRQKSLKDLFGSETSKDGRNEYRQALQMEEVTSAWDEHDGPMLTPSKRSKIPCTDSEVCHGSKKRNRCGTQKAEIEFNPLKEHVARQSNSKVKKQLDLMQVYLDLWFFKFLVVILIRFTF